MSQSSYSTETIHYLHYWHDTLLSLRIKRPSAYRFTPGQFSRIGLQKENGEIVWRALSIVSADYDDFLEYFAVIVPNGEFTSLLTQKTIGDTLYLDKTSFGFLTTNRFVDGKHLWLLATGTGLASFISIVQDPQIWTQYEKIILAHSVRHIKDLAYQQMLTELAKHPLIGQYASKFVYIPIVTRETHDQGLHQRFPALIQSGQLEQAAQTRLQPEDARIMICGNPTMVEDSLSLLKSMGYAVSRSKRPGQIVLENAF